jgi:hypothetical protein
MNPGGGAAPRAAVYLYTQTGQLREVSDALTGPLQTGGWNVRRVDVRPRQAFPFPWPVRRFFGVFADAVDPDAEVDLVEPAGGFASADDELVVLAYQVWFLAPSLPIRSLLKSHPECVAGRDVVTLIACRNMWYSAAIEVAALLRSAGARSVDVVAATDTRGSATTLLTTLRWLLTGHRDSVLFGRAGIGAAELARVAEVGRRLAERQPIPAGAAPVVPALAAADLLAGRAFRRWAGRVRATPPGSVARGLAVGTFVGALGVAIVAGLPLLGLAALLGGGRFAAAMRAVVSGAITSGRSAADHAAYT